MTTPAPGGSARLRVPIWAWPVGAMLAQKLLFWAFVAWRGAAPLGEALTRWDGEWYAQIATAGYRYPNLAPDGHPLNSNLAFFPLFPMTARAVGHLTGNVRWALVFVALVGSCTAVAGLVRLGTLLANQAVGVVLALLWVVLPRSFLEAMAYSEGLFTALTVWTFVFVAERRWWRAAICCALAGLTRPTGVSTFLGFSLALLVDLVAARREGRGRTGCRGGPGPSVGRSLTLALAGALGLVAAVGHVDLVTHAWRGYFAVQEQWDLRMGSPQQTWLQWQHERQLVRPSSRRSMHEIVMALPVWTASLVAALIVAIRRPRWWPVISSALVLWLMMASTQTYFQSKERYLLPAVGCLVPLALGIARALTWRRLRLPLAAVWLAAAIVSARWGADIVTTSTISP